jgi:hypothetical protein
VPEFLGRIHEPESLVEESYEPTNIKKDLHETEIEDYNITLEIVIHKPSPKHILEHPKDNARLNTPTEANTPPREVANSEAPI